MAYLFACWFVYNGFVNNKLFWLSGSLFEKAELLDGVSGLQGISSEDGIQLNARRSVN